MPLNYHIAHARLREVRIQPDIPYGPSGCADDLRRIGKTASDSRTGGQATEARLLDTAPITAVAAPRSITFHGSEIAGRRLGSVAFDRRSSWAVSFASDSESALASMPLTARSMQAEAGPAAASIHRHTPTTRHAIRLANPLRSPFMCVGRALGIIRSRRIGHTETSDKKGMIQPPRRKHGSRSCFYRILTHLQDSEAMPAELEDNGSSDEFDNKHYGPWPSMRTPD